MTDDKLSRLVQMVEAAEDASSDSRINSQRDRDYYDGIQWTAEEQAALAARKQPPITINRIKRKVDYLCGYERKLRTDPKALPRTPLHERDADAATDALRFVADDCGFAEVASQVWESLMIEGMGGAILSVKQRANREPRIVVDHIPWDRLLVDPHSRRKDFSDAAYVGIIIWTDASEAKAMFPEAAATIDQCAAGNWSNTLGTTTDDRPQDLTWVDNQRKRVKLVELHWSEGGQWWRATFCRGGFVAPPEVSPFRDEEGNPFCPIILASAYVNRDNQRYGIVRDMIGPQDEINKRRSKALHLMSVRQVVADEGAVRDENQARKELAKPDGFIQVAPNMRFEIQQTGDMAAAQFNLLQEAKNEIDLLGPNAALQGKAEGVQSGRAIIAQQQGGSVELEHLFGHFRAWKKRIYTAIWNAIRQYWTGSIWVRVTDNEKNLRWVGLNTPAYQTVGPDGMPATVPPGPQLAQLEVDIIIDETPDTVTIQAEQFAQLAEMAGSGVPIPPDVLIEASSLRNKDKLLERMRADPQAEAAQQELAHEGATAQVAKVKADAMKSAASAQKTMVEAQNMATAGLMTAF